MKILLISMPDVAPILIHEAAIHLPNHGIASVGGNIDAEHEVWLIDLVRKRRSIKRYLSKVIQKKKPDLVGLSAMAWQYDTCVRIARLIKSLLPEVKIVVGGYHATLMHEEIAISEEVQWIDFIIRGEGEEACRRLVNSLAVGRDRHTPVRSAHRVVPLTG
jgi:anaerobic magnesium-protoporphyrin IX monomethyl ester cyclase